ncbi:MAG TPA: prepilin-type N-terminal cleavage/methylation domain-containing protein [Bacilli bacterium]|nr:prepilin-type N-terminal cleavage/methylation domain-containing protein [Bacilli bacterium]
MSGWLTGKADSYGSGFQQGERGYTLLELLLTLAVIGVLFALITPPLANLYQRYELDIATHTLAAQIRSEQVAARAHHDTHEIWLNKFTPSYSVWENRQLKSSVRMPIRIEYALGYLETTVGTLRMGPTGVTTGNGTIRLVNQVGQEVSILVYPVSGAVVKSEVVP